MLVTVFFTGHSSSVKHLDWSEDSNYLRSNSADYELLFWKVSEASANGNQVTEGEELDNLDEQWATSTCPVTFNTMGIWPKAADGTDINAIAVDNQIVAVAGLATNIFNLLD